MKQYLFNDEEILSESLKGNVTLTNYRIRHENSKSSGGFVTSIFLNKISSVEINYKSNPIYIVLALLGATASILLASERLNETALATLAFAVVSFIFFLISRRQLLIVASDGGSKINVEIKGTKKQIILDFMNKIEHAKKNFLREATPLFPLES